MLRVLLGLYGPYILTYTTRYRCRRKAFTLSHEQQEDWSKTLTGKSFNAVWDQIAFKKWLFVYIWKEILGAFILSSYLHWFNRCVPLNLYTWLICRILMLTTYPLNVLRELIFINLKIGRLRPNSFLAKSTLMDRGLTLCIYKGHCQLLTLKIIW